MYSLRVGEGGQPAVSSLPITCYHHFHTNLCPSQIHVVGQQNEQVVWTRPPQVGSVDGKVQTIYPASVTFYPEVRPFLDAIIVALVVWEKMKGVAVQI